MTIELDPALITHEPADDVGEHLERVWYDGRRIPHHRYTRDGFTRVERVAACEEARLRHEARIEPGIEDHLPYA